MSGLWRTARVFISSTFLDMQAERDHLVRVVFPRLREALLPRRVHVVDVDLRWGVTAEQDALTVCRSIIDECRPHFLCMLGGRFGWTPPGKSESITVQEILYATLERPDARARSLFYFRDDATTASMEERRVGDYRETPGSDAANKLACLKQDVRAWGFEPVTYSAIWDRDLGRLTHLEEFGNRVYDDLLQSILQNETVDSAYADEFAEDNAAIETWTEERTSRWAPNSRSEPLRQLAEFASGDAPALCLQGPPGSGKTALFAAFYDQRRTERPNDLIIPHFVGANVASSFPEKMLRRLCHELYVRARLDLHRDNRLAGLERKFLPKLSLYRNCPEQLREIGTAAEEERKRIEGEYLLADDAEALRRQFVAFLAFAASRQNVLIVVDSIDQLFSSDRMDGISWIPSSLPKYAKILVSTSTAFPLERVRRRISGLAVTALPPLLPEESLRLVITECGRYGKSLTSAQLDSLLAKREAGNPQYLVSAVEELRTIGSYETIDTSIRTLPDDRQSLIEWVFVRLEDDPAFRRAAGESRDGRLVARSASLLAASRLGLTERELTGLIEPGESRGDVAVLLRFLRHYLVRRGDLIAFSDPEVRRVVTARYIDSPVDREQAHRSLADWFRSQADPLDDRSWSGNDPRPFRELVYHLCRSRVRDLPDILLDFAWLRARAEKGQTFEMIEDFREAVQLFAEDDDGRSALATVLAVLDLSGSTIAEDSNQLASQLLGRIDSDSHPLLATLLGQARHWRGSLWMTTEAPQLTPPGSRSFRVVRAHDAPITATARDAQGSRVVSAAADSIRWWDAASGRMLGSVDTGGQIIGTLLVAPDAKVVAASIDGSVQVWDLAQEKLVRTLKLNESTAKLYVPSVALVCGGTMVAACDAAGAVRIWNLSDGTESPPLRASVAELSAAIKSGGVAVLRAVHLSGLPARPSVPTDGLDLEQEFATLGGDDLYDPAYDPDSMIKLEEPTEEELLDPAPTDRDWTELFTDVLGRRLVIKTGRLLWVWDLSERSSVLERVYSLDEWKTRRASAALSDDGRYLVLHYQGLTPITIDLDSDGRCPSPPTEIDSIRAFTANGRHAISAYRLEFVEWDVATGEICRRNVDSPVLDSEIFGLADLPEPRVLHLPDGVSLTASNTSLTWHHEFKASTASRSAGQRITAIRFFGDSTGAAVLDGSEHLRTWWHATQRLAPPVASVKGAVDISVSSEGRLLLLSRDASLAESDELEGPCSDEEYWSRMIDYQRTHPLTLRDARTGRSILDFGQRSSTSDSESIDSPMITAMSVRSSFAATADTHRVYAWSLRDGRKLSSIGPFERCHYPDQPARLSLVLLDDDWGPHAVVCSLAVSDDGSATIFGLSDGTVQVWDLVENRKLFTFALGRKDVGVAMTPCGTWAAALSERRLELWNLPKRLRLVGHDVAAEGADRRRTARLSISHDARRVAYAQGRAVCLAQFEPVFELARYTSDDTITACCLSPDGNTVLAADEVGRLLVLRMQGTGT